MPIRERTLTREKPGKLPRLCLAACAVLLLLGACGPGAAKSTSPADAARTRMLFIGNSYTFFNGGIDREVKGLAPRSETERIAASGYSLEDHWKDGAAAASIRDGGWSFVILQEQSQRPVVARESFYRYSRDFDAAIRKSGAKTVLLMTWERPDSVAAGVTTTNLANAYSSVAAELGAEVAPVGLAFARSLLERPDLKLYVEDGHPTSDGSYLAACVLYGVIFRQTPVGNPYAGPGVKREDAAYLQRVAAETLGF